MLALFAIPALLGVGLAYDYFTDEEDDGDENGNDQPIEITLDTDVVGFVGTEAKEHVEANALDNDLRGGDGNDKLSGHEGNDTIDTGAGDDRIFGGAGDDVAIGGDGDDRIFLSDGDDTAVASPNGSADAGDDLIRGGAGQDRITDGYGSNTIFGDTGSDWISSIDSDGSPDTPDTVHGGFGDDLVIGDAGDELTGGEGEDGFVVAARSDETGMPAMLLDFDVRDDLFSVVLLEEPETAPEITFEHIAETNQLAALVNGQQVALLNDIEAADVPFIQTFVTTLAELNGTTA